MSSIILPSAFDISKFSLGTVKTLDNSGKIVYVSYNSKSMVVQTPEMVATFGISKWSPDGTNKGENEKHSLELSFKDRANRASLEHFYKMMMNIDEFMIKEGMARSQEWFKKKYNTPEVMAAIYTPCVKFPKDKDTGEITDKFPPTFRIGLPMKCGKYTFDVFDENKNVVDLSQIETRGAKVTAIMQCSIWLAGGKYGCSWRPIQIRIVPPASIKGFAFQDIDEDKIVDSDIDEDVEPVVNIASKGSPKITNSDDEEDDDGMEEDEGPTEKVASAKENVEVTVETSEDEDEIEKPKAKKSVVLRKKK